MKKLTQEIKLWLFVIALVLAVAVLALATGPAAGTTLTIPFPNFSSGTTIDSGQMNSNFASVRSWGNGNIDGTNIVDESILAIDIGPGAVTTSEILDDTVSSSDIKLDTILAIDIATDAVTTLEILDLTVATADMAVDAAQVVTEDEEGVFTAGSCTTATTVPTSNPGVNTALRVATTSDSTDETLLAQVVFFVKCNTNCSNSLNSVAFTCNYDTTEDLSWGIHSLYTFNDGKTHTFTYFNSYTAVTGGSKDLDCYIWRAAGPWTGEYCARLIVQRIKR